MTVDARDTVGTTAPDTPSNGAAACARSPLGTRSAVGTRSPLGTFAECPHCGGALAPEHAHFKCRSCGWRDSCCD